MFEGAIRSSKTFTSLYAWDDFVLNSPDKAFGMSGNTLGTLCQNCIDDPVYGFIAITNGAARYRRDAAGRVFLDYAGKRIYLTGGNDESSFKKIQGLSVGGWYFDEGPLQNRKFIEVALGRSAASKRICNFMTLNPDLPTHWFYKDPGIGIDRWGSDHVPGLYRRFHFTLDDNPAISDERKAKLAASYRGVFYKRYILGLRVRGEGGCFPSFRNNKRGEPGNVLYEYPAKIYRVSIGVDFGGNKSATAFNATGWFIGDDKRTHIVTLEEEYITGIITPDELNRRWIAFYVRVAKRWPVDRGFADSAEQILRKGMNAAAAANRVPMQLENALKSEVVNRIRLFDSLFSQDRAHVMAHCKKSIEAWENAVWNEKNPTELERLDDGTTNIDSLDAAEYAVERDASMLMEETR